MTNADAGVPGLIQIQVATTLSEDGVGDVRWVLVEPPDAFVESPKTPAVPALASLVAAPSVAAFPVPGRVEASAGVPSSATPFAPSVGRSAKEPTRPAALEGSDGGDISEGRQAAKTYQILRAVVLAAALLGAWWVASSVLDHRPTNAKARVDSSAKRQ